MPTFSLFVASVVLFDGWLGQIRFRAATDVSAHQQVATVTKYYIPLCPSRPHALHLLRRFTATSSGWELAPVCEVPDGGALMLTELMRVQRWMGVEINGVCGGMLCFWMRAMTSAPNLSESVHAVSLWRSWTVWIL